MINIGVSKLTRLFLLLALAVFAFTSLVYFRRDIDREREVHIDADLEHVHAQVQADTPFAIDPIAPIMPKLVNETAKAILGRATWTYLHTMTLRYPEHPTQAQRKALTEYMYLTSTLYPCGDCATHFQKLLKIYPPQTSSRRAAASWLCLVHNKVNERLKKPEFDCTDMKALEGTYDCGCGAEEHVSVVGG